MNLTESQQQHRRGRILQILAASNDQGVNAPLLRTMVRGWGYKFDADTAAIDFAWLEQHGLVTRREIAGVELLRIAPRGRDVVTRDLDLPGVQLLED